MNEKLKNIAEKVRQIAKIPEDGNLSLFNKAECDTQINKK